MQAMFRQHSKIVSAIATIVLEDNSVVQILGHSEASSGIGWECRLERRTNRRAILTDSVDEALDRG